MCYGLVINKIKGKIFFSNTIRYIYSSKGVFCYLNNLPYANENMEFQVIHWLGRGNWFERLQSQKPQKLITQEV